LVPSTLRIKIFLLKTLLSIAAYYLWCGGIKNNGFSHNKYYQTNIVFYNPSTLYVGDKMKRFFIPVSYMNQPPFQELLNKAEEEFRYDHPTAGG